MGMPCREYILCGIHIRIHRQSATDAVKLTLRLLALNTQELVENIGIICV
jgi:hypothetical protein